MVVAIFGAVAIGLTLGLLGSGGSILTVPVLVYLVGHEGKVAIAESLAIVGAIALIGMLPYAKQKQVDWRSVFYFGVPGMIGTYGGAWLSQFVTDAAQLILFAGVMLVAAFMMFRKKATEVEELHRHPVWQIVLEGTIVGVITGLVGVGGGFLIVPALVILGGLPMRLAVGTSLVIVALKSFSGFVKYLGVLKTIHATIDLQTVVLFAIVGIVGTLVGNALSQRVNQAALKRGFAVFLLLMSGFVLYQEVPKMMHADVPPHAHAAVEHQQ